MLLPTAISAGVKGVSIREEEINAEEHISLTWAREYWKEDLYWVAPDAESVYYHIKSNNFRIKHSWDWANDFNYTISQIW